MDWLAVFTPEELAPEDLVKERVYEALLGDETLVSVFGNDRMYCLDFPPILEPGALPDLTVAPFTGADTPRPGFLSTAVTIYVSIRFLWPRSIQAVHGQAGIATLGRHINRVLLSDAHMRLPVLRGDPPRAIPLAQRPVEPGSADWKPIGTPADPAVLVILPYNYVVSLDKATQRPAQLVNAGF